METNLLVKYLGKPSEDFTKADLIKYIEENNVQMINFRYTAEDGRLKTLNFVISSRRHLDSILSCGERVDGSSLFSHIEAGSSDLYVIPRFKTAFLNPFSEIPTIDILCSYYNKDGEPLSSSPEYILRKAHDNLKKSTGLTFETMGELEYYIISERENLFCATDQKGYHESTPFAKWESFRTEAMLAIAQSGGKIKYGHSEVGNFYIDNLEYEQNEIEFTPVNVEDSADQLIIAKWILRVLAYKYGITITFAPKITTGKAGSGMHIHTRLMKGNKNMMVDKGRLSEIAKRAIAGYLDLAPSLTAFGNTIPTSYFRLVPHQEAPTNICWGDRNRSTLVRVPLGWAGTKSMVNDANPLEPIMDSDFTDKQTVEFRCPDGSANIHLLLAGLTVAANHGIEMPDYKEFVEKTYVDVNIFRDEFKEKLNLLNQLPLSCYHSAEMLKKQESFYLNNDIFTKNLIDGVIKKLHGYSDEKLRDNIKNKPEEVLGLVNKYFHCG